MAKRVVKKEMNKGLTRREASRLAQNERRKAERRLARELSEQLGSKIDRKEALSVYESQANKTAQMNALARTIRGLQSKPLGESKRRIGYDVDIMREAESIAAYTQIRYGSETLSKKGDVTLQNRNKMFERQINQSTMKNGLSALSRDETKSFYAATLDMWKGLSNADNRNAHIMMNFGVSDLSQVYSLLTDKDLPTSKNELSELKNEYFSEDTSKDRLDEIENLINKYGFNDIEMFSDWIENIDSKVKLFKRREIVKEELESIRGAQKTGGTTDDEEYNQPDEKTPETSPEYINRIISRIATALNYG